MAIKLSLSAEKILDKKFPIVPRGYDSLDVDSYLDSIIKDYLKVEENCLLQKAELKNLETTIDKLKAESEKLNIELAKYRERFRGIKPSDDVTQDNMKLLQRINALETYLYKRGIDPNTIK